MARKDDSINFRIEGEKKAEIEAIADEQNISLADYMRDVIEYYVLPVQPKWRAARPPRSVAPSTEQPATASSSDVSKKPA